MDAQDERDGMSWMMMGTGIAQCMNPILSILCIHADLLVSPKWVRVRAATRLPRCARNDSSSEAGYA